ncbi:unnamed protein product [Cochlearia groenlandica]
MDPTKEKKQKRGSSKIKIPSDISTMEKKKQKLSHISSPSMSKDELQLAMKKQNDVAMVLTGKIIDYLAKESNFIFSPASIYAAATMMAVAASGTISDEVKAIYGEIANLVFADGSSRGGPKISAINGAWVEKSQPVDYVVKDILENVFKATYSQVDFLHKAKEVLIELNKWVLDHTNGLIKNLLPPNSIKSDTLVVYGNALYFKGTWKQKFDKSLTEKHDFHLIEGKPIRVPFMKSYKKQYVKAYNGFKVLRLPYNHEEEDDDDKSPKFSMSFYLPDKKDGLDSLAKEITSTPGFLDSHCPEYKVVVGDLRIPKFKIEFSIEASKALDGLEYMFMYHKACVEVDEDGAEAAAATFFGIGCKRPSPPIDFVADHPFLFLIREDKTGTVLFAGQIYNPK